MHSRDHSVPPQHAGAGTGTGTGHGGGGGGIAWHVPNSLGAEEPTPK